jgi:hypothetical protein
VAARQSSRYLYEFATDFIEFEGIPKTTYMGTPKSELPTDWGQDGDVLKPEVAYLKRRRELKAGTHDPSKVVFKKLVGTKPKKIADVLCAFRSGSGDGKAYPLDKSVELVDALISKGYTVACYGGKDNHYVDGAIDIRGWRLEEQCSAISTANCAIGHSSGTMHLASLCGCPHITWHVERPWLSHEGLRERYEKVWNPFNTPVKYISKGEPEPSDIIQTMEEIL